MTAPTVAATILSQLGGNMFLAMTGANRLSFSPDALSFRLPSASGANCVRIVLHRDLYDVTFFRMRGTKVWRLATVEGVYADSLRSVFTRQTGLEVTL